MGFVIHLSTKIKKVTLAEKLQTLSNSSSVYSEAWETFLNGEFERSTALNEKALGGRSAQLQEEDEEASFDVNMDKIMQRFKCFNQVNISKNSESDDTPQEPDNADKDTVDSEVPKIEVALPTVEPIDSNYSDAGFWKLEENIDDDVEALLAEYE